MKFLNLLQKSYQWSNTWGGLPCLTWIKAAEAYANSRYKQAAELYEEGLKEYPKHQARHCAMMDLAYCYFKLGEFTPAINTLNSVLKSVPNSKQAYLRLSYIYSWIGNDQEAMWLLRAAVQHFGTDFQLMHIYVSSMLEAEPPKFVIEECENLLRNLQDVPEEFKSAHKICLLIIDYLKGEYRSSSDLQEIANRSDAPISAKHLLAKILIKDGKCNLAREYLHQALQIVPDYPRTLSLIAIAYLESSDEQEDNLRFALQLATQAAQNSAWMSSRELKLLAKIYYQFGDKISALLLASKAQDINFKRSDITYSSKELDQFISSLTTGTLV